VTKNNNNLEIIERSNYKRFGTMKIESNDNNPIFIPKNSINLNLDENLNPKSTKVKVVARFRPINSVEDVKYNDYI